MLSIDLKKPDPYLTFILTTHPRPCTFENVKSLFLRTNLRVRVTKNPIFVISASDLVGKSVPILIWSLLEKKFFSALVLAGKKWKNRFFGFKWLQKWLFQNIFSSVCSEFHQLSAGRLDFSFGGRFHVRFGAGQKNSFSGQETVNWLWIFLIRAYFVYFLILYSWVPGFLF